MASTPQKSDSFWQLCLWTLGAAFLSWWAIQTLVELWLWVQVGQYVRLFTLADVAIWAGLILPSAHVDQAYNFPVSLVLLPLGLGFCWLSKR